MATTQNDNVIIKGVRGGLLLLLDDAIAWPDLLAELEQRVQANAPFFSGAKITANLGKRSLDQDELATLRDALIGHQMTLETIVSADEDTRHAATLLNLKSRAPSFAGGVTGKLAGRRKDEPNDEATTGPTEEIVSTEGGALFVRRTIRSGQRLRHNGDICIVGDVNAGAEIVADGDVVVWGSLRGSVHAGASGNDKAIVCALILAPIIVRIAEAAGRSPSPEPHRNRVRILGWGRPQAERATPEVARMVDGNIVVERWK